MIYSPYLTATEVFHLHLSNSLFSLAVY